jgi:catechol-2,3-dioxygenase
MSAPKFAHVVFRTSQKKAMTDWYCALLDGRVVYSDDGLTFITFDEEHHRVALIHPPDGETERMGQNTAAMHHTAYTFDSLGDLLERFEHLRDEGLLPAVCIAHGVTTSMYYKDPDGNFAEMQIDRFELPDDATAYMNGPEYAADSVGPQFDPQKLLEAYRGGTPVEELQDRAWALSLDMGDPMVVLMGPR